MSDFIEAEAAHSTFVVVDLESTASLMVANAMRLSDFAVIPLQASSVDAKREAKSLGFNLRPRALREKLYPSRNDIDAH